MFSFYLSPTYCLCLLAEIWCSDFAVCTWKKTGQYSVLTEPLHQCRVVSDGAELQAQLDIEGLAAALEALLRGAEPRSHLSLGNVFWLYQALSFLCKLLPTSYVWCLWWSRHVPIASALCSHLLAHRHLGDHCRTRTAVCLQRGKNRKSLLCARRCTSTFCPQVLVFDNNLTVHVTY